MLTNKLCKACEDGDIVEVEHLLASGATPNFASSKNGYKYPLHYAAAGGRVEIVKLLLQACPRKLMSVVLVCRCLAELKTHFILLPRSRRCRLQPRSSTSCVRFTERGGGGSSGVFQCTDPFDASCVSVAFIDRVSFKDTLKSLS